MNSIHNSLASQRKTAPCPPGMVLHEGRCITWPPDGTVERLTGAPTMPSMPMATAAPPPPLGDALTTMRSIGMTAVNVATVVGAVGGLYYLWREIIHRPKKRK